MGDKAVFTKFGGPESVLIHEIGHILGNRYGLYDWMANPPGIKFKTGKRVGQEIKADARRNRVAIAKELRTLVDATYEGTDASPSFKKYVRKAVEKEAIMLEAFIHAPQKMKELAPTVYGRFKDFLNDRTELRPLLDIKPSITLGVGEGKIKVPGVTKLGEYVAPENVGTLINNYLSPGLRRHGNMWIGGGYDLLRQSANTLNYVNLSLSLFHALNTTTDMMATQLGLGLRQVFATKGQTLAGIASIAKTPVSPFVNVWRGHNLKKAFEQDLELIQDPNMRRMVRAVVLAGGRSKMDVFYHNRAIKALTKSINDVMHGAVREKFKGVLKFPFLSALSAVEIAAKPVMEWLVPRQKLGAFYILANHEFNRRRDGQITDDQLWERLSQTWDNVDNRMGQLVYDNLFWNKTFKDMLMLAFRSVGWNLGSWREYGGAPIDFLTTGKRIKAGDTWMSQKMAYSIGAIAVYSMLGAVITYLLTGKGPEELKDYFFPKTGHKKPDGSDERLSLPTYAKDWWAYSKRPITTLSHKMHPIWSMLWDIGRNEDFYGTEIRNKDDKIMKQFLDVTDFVGESALPFSVKNYRKMIRSGREPLPAAATSITGIISAPAYLTKTHAQKLTTEYIVARLPRGARAKEKFDKSQRRKELKWLARSGKDIYGHTMAEGFTDKELKRIQKAAAQTPFAESFKRLTLEEALNVYAVATPDEKRQVLAIVKGKFERSTTKRYEEDVIKLYEELIGPVPKKKPTVRVIRRGGRKVTVIKK